MENNLLLKSVIAQYFTGEKNMQDVAQIIVELGILLGDDVLYSTLKTGENTLIHEINKCTNSKFLGKIIVNQLYKLIDAEINLEINKDSLKQQENLYSKILINKSLSNEELKFKNRIIKDCDMFLSEQEKITFYDKEYKVSDLTEVQKFRIIYDNTSEAIRYYYKLCDKTYQQIHANIISKILGSEEKLKRLDY